MTLNEVLLVRVIHMTKQFWDKIGQFDADKYAENVLKLECYKSVHAVITSSWDNPELHYWQQARPDNGASELRLCMYWSCNIYGETDGQTDGQTTE